MVGTKISVQTRLVWLTATSIAILMAVAAACGNSDEPASTVVLNAPPTLDESTVRSQSILDATDADDSLNAQLSTPKMVEVLVHVTFEPEVGSDEAAILKVFERQIKALNLNDWVGFLDTCDPRLAKLNSAEQLEGLWDTYVRPFAPALSYNRRNTEIQLYGGDIANVKSDLYSYDTPFFSVVENNVTELWVKVEGNWFMSNAMCHGGNLTLK